jgi:two-component system, sensor histidine kinase and response regulator
MKCLLVDDLEENLLALTALLRRPGLDIVTARSGTEALELLLAHEFALSLIDVQMPSMDGFELAELMRGTERTRQVPIIFVTAGGREQHRLFKGYELGAVDFLYKPIDAHILRSKAGVFFELYEQKQQLKAQLVERTETLRTNEMFMAILSHDLRNPLNAVVTGAELLSRTSDDPNVRKITERIRSSAQRMTGLVTDMLDMARGRLGGGLSLLLEPVDLVELFQRVAGELQLRAPDTVIEIEKQGDTHGHWDTGRLAQLLSNLLGNAVDHGTVGQPVRVKLDGSDPERLRIRIANSGAMPESKRQRLFEPFKPAERNSERGLGLGLYIARQAVVAHGGTIELEPDDGETTAFRIELPRQPARTDGAALEERGAGSALHLAAGETSRLVKCTK